MGLNVRLYNITNDGNYSIRYKSGDSPYPETNDSTFTLYNTGLTATTITISGLSFDTQYWIKMTDQTTGRYIIKNIYTHDSKAFPCYDTMCFDVQTVCTSPSPTPSPTPSLIVSSTPTPSVTPTSTPIPSVTPTNTLTPTLTPTPTLSKTPTPTPTKTPSVTPTPSPTYQEWNMVGCTNYCSGVVLCSGSYSVTLYTLPNVVNIYDSGVTIYTNNNLTTTFDGFFQIGSVIYEVVSGSITNKYTIGDGC